MVVILVGFSTSTWRIERRGRRKSRRMVSIIVSNGRTESAHPQLQPQDKSNWLITGSNNLLDYYARGQAEYWSRWNRPKWISKNHSSVTASDLNHDQRNKNIMLNPQQTASSRLSHSFILYAAQQRGKSMEILTDSDLGVPLVPLSRGASRLPSGLVAPHARMVTRRDGKFSTFLDYSKAGMSFRYLRLNCPACPHVQRHRKLYVPLFN